MRHGRLHVAWLSSALVGALLLLARPAHACAGCSNPNLPTGRGQGEALAPGELSVALHLTGTTLRVVHDEACPDIGPICAAREEPPQLHDQTFWVGELRPIVAWGLTPTWSVEAQLPLRLTRTTVLFRRLTGEVFAPDYENIHHRNETLLGPGDPWLLGRGAWRLGSVHLSARGGLTLPLGRTEENPFALGRAGEPHQHVQFGTGVPAPLLALDAATRLGRWGLSTWGQALLFPFANDKGYRAGHRLSGGVAADTVLLRGLTASLGADVLHEQPEEWDGRVEQDGNVGRTDVLVGGSLRYAFPGVTVQLAVKVPVWQHFLETGPTHGSGPGQLTYPALVDLSFQKSFGGTR